MKPAFPKMVEIVPEAQQGVATIEHVRITRFQAMMDSMRGMRTDAGDVAVLKIKGRVVMSDTAHEHYTNWDVVHHAKGDVLIAGLGLGMILHPILAKPDVTSVTVVEKHQDVIDLVAPTLKLHRGKLLNVMCRDIFEWVPLKGEKWDTIYFDIWPDICGDNLPEIATLHQRFKSRKRTGGWMNSWCAERLRSERRREQ